MSGSVYDLEPLQRFDLDEKVHFSKLKNLSALLHLPNLSFMYAVHYFGKIKNSITLNLPFT